jgi:hypothetical protein
MRQKLWILVGFVFYLDVYIKFIGWGLLRRPSTQIINIMKLVN